MCGRSRSQPFRSTEPRARLAVVVAMTGLHTVAGAGAFRSSLEAITVAVEGTGAALWVAGVVHG